ncbi:TPA: hypothetical protein ACH3X2_003536 [Trebouxia sp. C0005]
MDSCDVWCLTQTLKRPLLVPLVAAAADLLWASAMMMTVLIGTALASLMKKRRLLRMAACDSHYIRQACCVLSKALAFHKSIWKCKTSTVVVAKRMLDVMGGIAEPLQGLLPCLLVALRPGQGDS